jgi:hypothetical protein
MAFPEYGDLKTEVTRITGYTESGLTSSIDNLFNDELNALAINARPIASRNIADTRFPKNGIIYSTVNRAYGVLSPTREPVMYIKTEAVAEASYAEKYFIGMVSVGYRPSTDLDLATFTTAGSVVIATVATDKSAVQCWNMLTDATLITAGDCTGAAYTDNSQLVWKPIQELGVIAADYEETAYDGHALTITDYSGVATGHPNYWALDWKYPLYGMTDAGSERTSRGTQRPFLKVYPPPEESTYYTVRAFYRRRPAALSATGDINEITRRFPYLLVYRVAYRIMRTWLRKIDEAEHLALSADECLEKALTNEFDFKPTTGIQITPADDDPWGKRRGIRN